MPAKRAGHGWGAYFWPYLGFLAVVELSGRVPEQYDQLAAYLLPVKVAVPLGIFLYYYTRGHYPELRGCRFTLERPRGARGPRRPPGRTDPSCSGARPLRHPGIPAFP